MHAENKTNVGQEGFVRLVDTMPSQNLDAAVVQAARISTGAGVKTPDADRSLIRYLMRNRHTSPFEMVEFKFHLKMPVFIARQWMRHRMASINEYSGRYSEIPDQCYVPKVGDIRTQSAVNKQSSDPVEFPDIAAKGFVTAAKSLYDKSYNAYATAVENGIAREQARVILPQSMYTEFYWKMDLHNFLHFVRLRADAHAQKEIQDFAQACYDLVRPLVPVCCEAFEDYIKNSMTLSAKEVSALRKVFKDVKSIPAPEGLGKTEKAEFAAKIKRLGLTLE